MPELPGPVRVFFATPLEPEFVHQIAQLDPRIEVMYRPDLLGKSEYPGDHFGAAIQRTPEQQAEWDACLAQAEVLWDFDRDRPTELPRLAPNLKLLFHTSSGVAGWLGTSGLVESDVMIANAAGIHAIPMAEWAMFAMLYFAKDTRRIQMSQRIHHWDKRFCPAELHGATLALVGLGAVGSEIARRANQFGMRVIAHRRRTNEPLPSDIPVEKLYPREGLQEMLSQADYVVLIVASTPDTLHMIGRDELAALPTHAVVINLARGAIVDQEELVIALQQGWLAGAALDVFDPEPLESESPLWTLPNVLVTSHAISHSQAENERLTGLFSSILRSYLAGEPIPNLVDKRLGYSPEPAQI
ncbi:MAG: D-2-hydroxyacid dehydrogenase [Chloroflexota bacterium]